MEGLWDIYQKIIKTPEAVLFQLPPVFFIFYVSFSRGNAGCVPLRICRVISRVRAAYAG